MPPKKVARPAQENISLGPQVREGESSPSSRGESPPLRHPTLSHPARG